MPTSIIESQAPTRLFRHNRKSREANVPSGTVKKSIIAVFEGLGSWEAMLAWARENQTIFYTQLYAKLLPTEGYVKGSGSIRVLVYAPNGKDTELSKLGQDATVILQAEAQAAPCLDETQAE